MARAGFQFPTSVFSVEVEGLAPHCNPVVNEYDQIYAIRKDRVEAVWPILARGHSQ